MTGHEDANRDRAADAPGEEADWLRGTGMVWWWHCRECGSSGIKSTDRAGVKRGYLIHIGESSHEASS